MASAPSLKQRQEALLRRMMRDEMNGKGDGLFEARPFQVEVTRQLGLGLVRGVEKGTQKAITPTFSWVQITPIPHVNSGGG